MRAGLEKRQGRNLPRGLAWEDHGFEREWGDGRGTDLFQGYLRKEGDGGASTEEGGLLLVP